MAENSKIQWCDHTWSPWHGCQKVSEGCANCYAEARSGRNPGVFGTWGPHGTRVVRKDWATPLAWDRGARTRRTRPRIFPSICDPFEARDDLVEPRERFAALIQATPSLDWLLLTKRPEDVRRLATEAFGWDVGAHGMSPNVWMGTSTENQERADERVPILAEIPAVVRWLSIEPLLGPITLRPEWLDWLDWVVVGGESGARARRCDLAWIRALVDQCRSAGVSVFVKQLGALAIDSALRISIDGPGSHATELDLSEPKGGDPEEWPEDLRVREMPGVAR